MGSNHPLFAVAVLGLGLAGCAAPLKTYSSFTPEERAIATEYSSFLAARYAGMTDDPVMSAVYFRDAAAAAPGDPDMLDRAVASTLLAGDVPLAARLANEAGKDTIASAPYARLVRLVDLVADGKQKAALSLARAGGFGPLNEDIAEAIGAWAQLRTDPDAAIAAIAPSEQFLAPERLFIQGLLEQSEGREAAALARYEAAWAAGLRKPWTAEMHARMAARLGDTKRALDILDQQTARTGRDPAMAALQARLNAGERPVPKRLTAREGAGLSLYVLAAQTQLSPELIIVFDYLALHLDPGLDAARFAVAGALDEKDRAGEALAEYRRIGEASPFAVPALIESAWVLFGAGQTDTATALLQGVPQTGLAEADQLRMADLWFAMDRNAEAEAVYDRVVVGQGSAGEEDWRPLFARAAARQELGRWPEAEADLLKALEINPNQPEVLNFLGYGWVDRGERVEEGIALIRKALSIRPNAGHIVDSLGWAHYRTGDYQAAVQELERAAQLSPSDPEIIDHLGDAYWRAGQKREALYEWTRAMLLEPGGDLRSVLEGKIDTGLPDSAKRAGADPIHSSQHR
jgi:tetratricopeptide (TPR) repeat protein